MLFRERERENIKWNTISTTVFGTSFISAYYFYIYCQFYYNLRLPTSLLSLLLPYFLHSLLHHGFSLYSFKVLSKHYSFRTPAHSLLRTSVMMIGEINYADVFDKEGFPLEVSFRFHVIWSFGETCTE